MPMMNRDASIISDPTEAHDQTGLEPISSAKEGATKESNMRPRLNRFPNMT